MDPISGRPVSCVGRQPHSLVLMAAFSMDMAVFNLLAASFADIRDFNLKIEVNPGEGVIAIDAYTFPLNSNNGHEVGTLITPGFKLHSWLHIDVLWKRRPGDVLNHLLIPIPISVLRFNSHRELIANFPANEFRFQPGDEIALAVQVRERRALFRLVNHHTFVIGQGIVNSGNEVVFDLHGGLGFCLGSKALGEFEGGSFSNWVS